jgi:hypothetical protein
MENIKISDAYDGVICDTWKKELYRGIPKYETGLLTATRSLTNTFVL